jgi:hypothetical protein
MKLLITIFLNLILASLFAQRNPNTNAGKINPNYKSDTIINNQTKPNSEVSSPNQAVPPIAIDDNNSIQLGASLNYGTTFNQSDIMENGFGFGFKLGFNLIKDAPVAFYTGLGFDYLVIP